MRALENPKIRIRSGDAREVLLTSRARYDIIFSEPSNPYRAGISSLFTEEFYAVIRDRLAPGGLFLQWVQAYEVDGQTLRTVYATIGAVFPEVETWPSCADAGRPTDRSRDDVATLRARVDESPQGALALAGDRRGGAAWWLAGPWPDPRRRHVKVMPIWSPPDQNP